MHVIMSLKSASQTLIEFLPPPLFRNSRDLVAQAISCSFPAMSLFLSHSLSGGLFLISGKYSLETDKHIISFSSSALRPVDVSERKPPRQHTQPCTLSTSYFRFRFCVGGAPLFRLRSPPDHDQTGEDTGREEKQIPGPLSL